MQVRNKKREKTKQAHLFVMLWLWYHAELPGQQLHQSMLVLQVRKEKKELDRAFGSGPQLLPGKGMTMPDGKRMVTVMLFGNHSECENARRLIEEAVDNKEQKAKQRAKEYEKKKDDKRRDRQMYHLRHTNDYEELGLPLGASKVRSCCRSCVGDSALLVHS